MAKSEDSALNSSRTQCQRARVPALRLGESVIRSCPEQPMADGAQDGATGSQQVYRPCGCPLNGLLSHMLSQVNSVTEYTEQNILCGIQ